ncbi:MAG: hypothetical protein GY756_07600 [bacterium]|nr:hypothetical protein [bacterium]
MDISNEYITIEEASKITKKSVSTIRRFVLTHKDSGDGIIKVDINDRNRPLYRINKQFILTYFDIAKKSFKKNVLDKDSNASLDKKIMGNYLYYKKSYNFLKKVFIIFLIFTIIFDVFLIVVFVFYKHDLKEDHTKDNKYLSSQIDELNLEVKNNRKDYQNILLEYKELWRKNTEKDNERSKRIDRDNIKLNKIYEELKIKDKK